MFYIKELDKMKFGRFNKYYNFLKYLKEVCGMVKLSCLDKRSCAPENGEL